MLEGRVQDLKKNLEFLHEAKSEEAAGKEMSQRFAGKKMEEGQKGNIRRLQELLQKNEELQAALTRKNMTISNAATPKTINEDKVQLYNTSDYAPTSKGT